MEKLTKQEEDVMRVIWQLRKCGVKDVVEVLPAPKPPYTTVASVINNLKNKAFVTQTKYGKAYLYEPAIEENEYKTRFMSGFVRDYFRNSFKEMVTFFAKDEKISEQELKEIIEEIEHGSPTAKPSLTGEE